MPRRTGAVLFVICLLAACHQSPDSNTGPDNAGVAHIIPKPPSPAPVQRSSPGLHLPVSFRSSPTCSGCPVTDTVLELRSDHSFLLEERDLGNANDNVRRSYTLGHFVQADGVLRLEARAEGPRYWQILDSRHLRRLGPAGKPIKSENTVLVLSSQPLLSGDHLLLRGHYVFMDDVGFFRDCETNHSWPVATAGDSDALEQAYTAISPERLAVVFARVEAHLAHQPNANGRHSEEALVIDRLIDINRREDCKTAPP